jgi:hypothetical protein
MVSRQGSGAHSIFTALTCHASLSSALCEAELIYQKTRHFRAECGQQEMYAGFPANRELRQVMDLRTDAPTLWPSASGYGVGVLSIAAPTQVKSRLSLVAPAEVHTGCPWASDPLWRIGVIHQRMT